MPRLDWRLAVRVVAGFVAGLAIWLLLSPLYDRVIAASAQKVLNAFERPDVTRLHRATDGYITVNRTDFDPRSKRPAIPLHDLTFNIILLAALFATSKRVFSDRNMFGFVVAAMVLAVTHVLGLVTEVMSIYVAKLGGWSKVHYTAVDRNVWGVASHFYRLVLMYALAFALWWVFRDTSRDQAGKTAPVAKKRKRR